MTPAHGVRILRLGKAEPRLRLLRQAIAPPSVLLCLRHQRSVHQALEKRSRLLFGKTCVAANGDRRFQCPAVEKDAEPVQQSPFRRGGTSFLVGRLPTCRAMFRSESEQAGSVLFLDLEWWVRRVLG